MAKYNVGDRFDLGADGRVEITEHIRDGVYGARYLDQAGQPVTPVNESELDAAAPA